MLVNPIENASPLTIQRLRNLMADYQTCLKKRQGHPKDISRISKAIKAEFLKDFCGLFGKTVTVEEADRGYMRLDAKPQVFETPLASWLSRVQILMPSEGQSVNPDDCNCQLHCGEVQRLMEIVQDAIERSYG